MRLTGPFDEITVAVRAFLLRRAVGNDDDSEAPEPRGSTGASALHVSYAWDLAGSLSNDPAILELRSCALARPAAEVDEVAGHLRKPSGLKWPLAGALAASIALTISFVPAWRTEVLSLLVNEESESREVAVASGIDAQQLLNLVDGSVVRLDANSRINIEFTKQQRVVHLVEGRAYFDVAHEARPFIVKSPGGETIDIGTRFVVDTNSRRTLVSLIEGKIAVHTSANVRVVDIRPGEAVSYRSDGSVLSKAHAAPNPLGWTEGQLGFNDTPLEDVAVTLSRYSQAPILLAPDVVAQDRRVTGVFLANDSQNFASSLAAALDLRVEVMPNGAKRLTRP